MPRNFTLELHAKNPAVRFRHPTLHLHGKIHGFLHVSVETLCSIIRILPQRTDTVSLLLASLQLSTLDIQLIMKCLPPFLRCLQIDVPKQYTVHARKFFSYPPRLMFLNLNFNGDIECAVLRNLLRRLPEGCDALHIRFDEVRPSVFPDHCIQHLAFLRYACHGHCWGRWSRSFHIDVSEVTSFNSVIPVPRVSYYDLLRIKDMLRIMRLELRFSITMRWDDIDL